MIVCIRLGKCPQGDHRDSPRWVFAVTQASSAGRLRCCGQGRTLRPTSPTPAPRHSQRTCSQPTLLLPAGRPYPAYAPMAGLLAINPGPAIKMPDNPLGRGGATSSCGEFP